MRTVATNELSGIELEWAFGETTLNRQYVHELDDSLLFLVGLDECRSDSARRYEATREHSICAILIERLKLSITFETAGFRVAGFSDPRPYGDEPRVLSGVSTSLPEAVARAVCSYSGERFIIPADVADLHRRRMLADKADQDDFDPGPTHSELVEMGVFDGASFR